MRIIRKVEPGGIEPPSRCSRHAASTRVSADLVLVWSAGRSTLLPEAVPGKFSQCDPRGRRISASLLSSNPALAGVEQGSAAVVRPRERKDAQQSLFCVIFTRPSRPSTRNSRASHARSKPHRPRLSKSGESEPLRRMICRRAGAEGKWQGRSHAESDRAKGRGDTANGSGRAAAADGVVVAPAGVASRWRGGCVEGGAR